MPGPHIAAFIMQCWPDVDGADVWLSSWYTANHQWWEGWHTTPPFRNWHSGQDGQWFLIGYEKWCRGALGERMREAYYQEPNPSTSQRGEDLTPVGHWYVRYNARGDRTDTSYNGQPLTWQEEDAFLN